MTWSKYSFNPVDERKVRDLSIAIDRVMTEYPRRQRRNRLHRLRDKLFEAEIPRGHWLWSQLAEAEYQTTIGAFP